MATAKDKQVKQKSTSPDQETASASQAQATERADSNPGQAPDLAAKAEPTSTKPKTNWALVFGVVNFVLVLLVGAGAAYAWYSSHTSSQLLSQQLEQRLATTNSALNAQLSAISQLNSDVGSLAVNYSNTSAEQSTLAARLESLAGQLDKVRPLADTETWQIGQLIYLADRERSLHGDSAIILGLLQRALQYLPMASIGSASLRQSLELDIENYSQAELLSHALWLQQLVELQAQAGQLDFRAAPLIYSPGTAEAQTDANASRWQRALEQSWQRLQGLVSIETGDQSLPVLLNRQQSASVKLLLLSNLNQAGISFNRGNLNVAQAYLRSSIELIEQYAIDNSQAATLAAAMAQLLSVELDQLPALSSLSSFAIWSQQQ